MKLILIRHAKTKQESNDGSDFSRELKKRGLDQCEVIKDYFKSIDLNACSIICSEAKRTVQTYELALRGVIDCDVFFTKNIYLPFMFDILKEINRLNHEGDLIIIGHNYSLSELLYYLTEENITMKTGSLAVIDFDVQNSSLISGQSGRLLQYFESD